MKSRKETMFKVVNLLIDNFNSDSYSKPAQEKKVPNILEKG